MEERIRILVENTFNNFDTEECKQVIADRISWYEMKILKLEQRIIELEEMIQNSEDFKNDTLAFDVIEPEEEQEVKKVELGFRK